MNNWVNLGANYLVFAMSKSESSLIPLRVHATIIRILQNQNWTIQIRFLTLQKSSRLPPGVNWLNTDWIVNNGV